MGWWAEIDDTGGGGCCTMYPVVNSHLQFRATCSNIMLGWGRGATERWGGGQREDIGGGGGLYSVPCDEQPPSI